MHILLKVGGWIGARSINIYVGYMQARSNIHLLRDAGEFGDREYEV